MTHQNFKNKKVKKMFPKNGKKVMPKREIINAPKESDLSPPNMTPKNLGAV